MTVLLEDPTVRVLRIFVSSPSDVGLERALLDEVVGRINHTLRPRQLRLELMKWEQDIIPQIGSPAQEVINNQMTSYGIYLGIMATRFGTSTGRWGSGTEQEFREALERFGAFGTPWILFYFNRTPVDPDKVDWQQFSQVERFRNELAAKGLYAPYVGARGTPESFFEKVELHLRQLVERHLYQATAVDRSHDVDVGTPTVPSGYRKWLREHCADVELLGLQFKQGHSIRLNNVYVPLTTKVTRKPTSPSGESNAPDERLLTLGTGEEKRALLMSVLGEHSVYVSGTPGSGKSTFCRWVAWVMCEERLPEDIVPAPVEYQEAFPVPFLGRLPVLLRLREFWGGFEGVPDGQRASAADFERAFGTWLVAKQATDLNWPLIQAHLDAGSALLMLDGLDEVPLTRPRYRGIWHPRTRLLESLSVVLPHWIQKGNRVLVTSRPYGIPQDDVRRLTLQSCTIDPIGEELQTLLVKRWFHALSADGGNAEKTAVELLAHVQERDWLTPLRTSPMLLTAMCVVYGEGKRLPQDRHELYARITDNILHNRFPGDTALIETVRSRLSVIAHGMHTGVGLDEMRSTPEAETTFAEVDRMIQAYRDESSYTEAGFVTAVEAREQLLSQSGLLLPRDRERASFYHLSIQEFLAAQRMADIDAGRLPAVFQDRASRPEWRNTLSFVFGALVAKSVSPERCVRLVTELIATCRDDEVGLSVVIAECLDILLSRGIRLQESAEKRAARLWLGAIEREIPCGDRWLVAMTLGRLGDPRIAQDLRNPDGYVKIDAGEYRFNEGLKTLHLKEDVWISRHVVTNSQYEVFVREGGYRAAEKWWSEGGREWLDKSGFSEPFFWRSARWSGPNQPVVGVSAWEAEAFCAWAGGRLPREAEWEMAAHGPHCPKYPWGGAWREAICNVREAGLGVTSPVGMFPSSQSAVYGLHDTGGNVWEWCADSPYAEDASDSRLLRGCSWNDDAWYDRWGNRGRLPPSARTDHVGFRVLRTAWPAR